MPLPAGCPGFTGPVPQPVSMSCRGGNPTTEREGRQAGRSMARSRQRHDARRRRGSVARARFRHEAARDAHAPGFHLHLQARSGLRGLRHLAARAGPRCAASARPSTKTAAPGGRPPATGDSGGRSSSPVIPVQPRSSTDRGPAPQGFHRRGVYLRRRGFVARLHGDVRGTVPRCGAVPAVAPSGAPGAVLTGAESAGSLPAPPVNIFAKCHATP